MNEAIMRGAHASTMSKTANKAKIEIGRGNVFAKLDLPHPEERLRKARLMNVINDVIKRRGLTQKGAAEATGLNQADISRIQHGRSARYSTDRLMDVLAKLGIDVEIRQFRDAEGLLSVEVRELISA